MRYFIAGLGSESHSRSPIPTDRAAFEQTALYRGDACAHDTVWGSLLRRWRDAIAARGDQVSEGLVAFAQPGAPLPHDLFTALRDDLLHDLQRAGPVDVVLLWLHGAMLTDRSDDPEGDLLADIRARVGPRTVIAALCDLHAHLTPQKWTSADLLLCGHDYPHIDVPARADRLLRLAQAMAHGTLRPCHAIYDCRMIGLWPTTRPPLSDFIQMLRQAEGDRRILAVQLFHGFPFGDTAAVGAKLMVTTDGDATLARDLAQHLGRTFVGLRSQIDPPLLTYEQALQQSTCAPRGPVVWADVADNPDSGAAGDATHLLHWLLAQRAAGVLGAILHDPGAAQICRRAGRGAAVTLQIGGRNSPLSGAPLPVHGRVRSLTPPDLAWPFGTLAWVESPDLSVVVGDVRRSLNHPAVLAPLGIDLRNHRIVVVKSANHFEAGFAGVSGTLLRVVGPGDTAPDFRRVATQRRGLWWPRDTDPFADAQEQVWTVDATSSARPAPLPDPPPKP